MLCLLAGIRPSGSWCFLALHEPLKGRCCWGGAAGKHGSRREMLGGAGKERPETRNNATIFLDLL